MDKETYEKNMAAMRKRFPGLAKLVEEKRYELDEDIKIFCGKALDGSDILRVRKDGRTLYLNGKREPSAAAKRVLERWGELKRQSPIFTMGMGDIVFLKQFLLQTEKDVNIVVYEPSVRIFLCLMENVDITAYFEDRAVGFIIKGLNDTEQKEVMKSFVTLANIGTLKQYVNPNYAELFPEEALQYLQSIDRVTTEIVSGYNTRIRYGAVEADNLFHNISYLCDGYITTQLCEVIPRDIPAIVVSAGPSLNKNINELRKAKNRAFIVAVDTAVKPLVKAGIIPDLYAVVDGLKPSELLDFEEAKEIPMMTSISSAKQVLAQHIGKKIFYFEGSMLPYKMLAMNGIPFSSVSCGGSVACSAFSLVYKMGFSRIILVGQDLALTGNKTHADGTFQEKMEEIDTSRCLMVEGNYEEKVPTRGDFKMYLDWFNYYIAGCEGIHVINATEGGAKIQNTEIMTLADAIRRECGREVDLDACFAKLKPALNEEARKRAVAYLNTVPDMFRSLRKEVKKEKENYKKLQRICRKTSLDKSAYLSLLNRIKRTTATIEGHELYGIISNSLPVAEYMINSEQFLEEDSIQAEGLEIARKGIMYTELVDQCIGVFIPLAEETIGKLK